MAAPWEKYQQAQGPWTKYASAPAQDSALEEGPPAAPNMGALGNIGMGALKSASDIGSTLLWPVDALHDLVSPQERNLSNLVSGEKPKSRHEQRKEQLAQFFAENADPNSLAFKGGEVAGAVAGTSGVGGALGAGAKAVGLGAAAPLLESGGG